MPVAKQTDSQCVFCVFKMYKYCTCLTLHETYLQDSVSLEFCKPIWVQLDEAER